MIYLDNAATTLHKPPRVAQAVARAIETCGGAGRGGHRAARMAAEVLFDCREAAAGLFGVESPEQIVFTQNATHALNIAIKALTPPGGRVLTSSLEHNAVTRPLHVLSAGGANLYANGGRQTPNRHKSILNANERYQTSSGYGVTLVGEVRTPLFDHATAVAGFREGLKYGINLIVCTHVSNAFGYILPIEEIIALAGQTPVIIDAAQSAGSIPIDAGRYPNVYWCMPGHKGLYGPQGTGILILPRAECNLKTLIEGGTGSASEQPAMPDYPPDRFEAGTHNVPGVAGLLEGIRYVAKQGADSIGAHERVLIREAAEGLLNMPGVTVYSGEHQNGVLSFRVDGKDGEQVLARMPEFCLRAGLHCAPAAHRTVGTLQTGTIRLSVSSFTTSKDIRAFLRAFSTASRF